MKRPQLALVLALLPCAVLSTGCDWGSKRTTLLPSPSPTKRSLTPAGSKDGKGETSLHRVETRVLGLRIGRSSLLGNFRTSNDHTLDTREFSGWMVCVVADGMGGTGVGEVGSKRGVVVVVRELKSSLPMAAGADAIKPVIRCAVIAANDELIALGRREKQFVNAGSSVVVVAWKPAEGMYVASLGDSRAYRVQRQEIKQLTVDHSLAQALVEKGTITAEQARTHRFRNVLWKYLGTTESHDGPEVHAVPFEPGDRVLLCTRGLTDVVPDDGLLRCVRDHTDAQKCAEALTTLGLNHNSRDNVSCMVLAATAE